MPNKMGNKAEIISGTRICICWEKHGGCIELKHLKLI